jgi:hypothetical protein
MYWRRWKEIESVSSAPAIIGKLTRADRLLSGGCVLYLFPQRLRPVAIVSLQRFCEFDFGHAARYGLLQFSDLRLVQTSSPRFRRRRESGCRSVI